jgi:two-component system, NarL family, nitrate/nitrite response regulator NarL
MSVDGGGRFDLLTKRERQIAALVGNGLSNKVIAHTLNLSEGTIKAHVHRIFQKLRISNRYGLIAASNATSIASQTAQYFR